MFTKKNKNRMKYQTKETQSTMRLFLQICFLVAFAESILIKEGIY